MRYVGVSTKESDMVDHHDHRTGQNKYITTHVYSPWRCLSSRHKLPKYRIYSCISRPFITKKSAQKITLNLYTSHTQRPDQAIQEISITIA